MLTISSHTPGFSSPDCPKYTNNNSMLNGIHCTDYQLGVFIDKLQKHGILDDTVVIIVGDHMMFPTPQIQKMLDSETYSDWYGQVYLAIYAPNRDLSLHQNVFGVTPDLAPTIMDLLDIQDAQFVNGKSLLGERQKYSHIVAPGFEIVGNTYHREAEKTVWNECRDDDVLKADLSEAQTPLTKCQRARIFAAIKKHVYK